MDLTIKKPLINKIMDFLVMTFLISIIGGVFFWIYKNKINTSFTVKKIGIMNYQNGLQIEFIEFNSSQLSCVASITTNQGSPYGSTSIFCK